MTNWAKVKYSHDKNPEIFPTIQRINDIDDEIYAVLKEKKAELEKLNKEKEEIQNNCDHHYHLEATGMYDDSYRCKFCGHETTR